MNKSLQPYRTHHDRIRNRIRSLVLVATSLGLLVVLCIAVSNTRLFQIAFAQADPTATPGTVIIPPTPTETPAPPTPTNTDTPLPPTPTNTHTPLPPSPTNTDTPAPPPTPTNANTSLPPTPPVLLGKLQVTKLIERQGDSNTIGQSFQICIQGPSYPTGAEQGACQDFADDGESKLWTGLIAGSYVVREENPGSDWTVAISGSPVTVQDGQTGYATVKNVLQNGVLNVVTSVDWGNVPPISGQTFEVCILGPSYPTPNCQIAGASGSTLIWADLSPGSYAVTQNAHSAWNVTITGNPANVVANQTASVFVDYSISPASMRLTVSADKMRVSAGEEVTYFYLVENSGASPFSNLLITGSDCFPINYASGDINGNGRMEVTESWAFSCLSSVDADTDNRATAYGIPPFGGPISSNRSSVTIDVIPKISVNKSVAPEVLPEPGGLFTYELALLNQSSEPVTIVDLQDSYPLGTSCQNLLSSEIAVGQKISCTYQVAHVATGNFTNMATFTVIDDEGNQVTANDGISVSVVDHPASIDVTYESPQTIPASGTIARFTVIVRNTSLGDEVTITSLSDSIAGDLTQAWLPIESTDCSLPQTLGVSGTDGIEQSNADTYTCTVDIRVEGQHGALFTHYLTAKGTDDDDLPVEATDSTSILIFDEATELRLDASPAITSLSEPGGELEFKLQVFNDSASSSILIEQLVASTFGSLTEVGGAVVETSCELPQLLQASQSYECKFKARIEGSPFETIESTVVVSGQSIEQEIATAFTEVAIEITDSPAMLQVSTAADKTILPESGGEVTFDVTVRNTSPVDTVTINTLLDEVLGNQGLNCPQLISEPLIPGSEATCQYTGFIQGDSGQTYAHEVMISGIDDDGQAISVNGTVVFDFTDVPSQISVDYRTDKDSVPSAGEPVTYSIEVRNESVADLVTITSLSDSLYGDITALDSTCTLPIRLEPGQPYLCTFQTFVSGQLGEQKISELEVRAEDDDQLLHTENASATLLVAEPILYAMKRAELIDDTDDIASPGESLRYNIMIENQGNAVAMNVRFIDILGNQLELIVGSVTTTQGIVNRGNNESDRDIEIDLATIEPGDTVSVQFDVRIASDISTNTTTVSNQAILTGDNFPATSTSSPKGNGPTITDIRSVARLSAQKSATLDDDKNGDGLVSPGDRIAYEIKIFNRGQADAEGVLLDDVLDNNVNIVAGSVSTTQGKVQSGNMDGDSLVQVAIGPLAPESSVVIRFIVQVKLKLSNTQITNQAVITSEGLSAIVTDDPSTATENDSTITTLNGEALLDATKTALLLLDNDQNSRVSDGDLLVYQLAVQNVGSGTASNVRLRDTIDANTILVAGSVQTDQGEVVVGNATGDDGVDVVLGDILPGENAGISFQARINVINTNDSSGLVNQAIIQYNNIDDTQLQVLTDDPTITGPQNPTFTSIEPGPILLLTNEDFLLIDANEDGRFSPNDTILYRITIENVGTDAAQSILFSDRLDAKTKLIPGSIRADDGTVISGNQDGAEEIIIELKELNSGEETTISFLAQIAADVAALTISNQAEIRIGQANNPPTGLSVLLSDDPGTPALGDATVTILGGVNIFYVPIFDARERDPSATAQAEEPPRILIPLFSFQHSASLYNN